MISKYGETFWKNFIFPMIITNDILLTEPSKIKGGFFMYDKVSTNLNFVEREVEVQKFWKENNIFEKSNASREGCPVFTFYDGPPTANGKPHIGHIITRAVKDLIPRYKTTI